MEKMRLDKYLSKVLGVSRSQVAQLVDKKMVLVNGAVAEKNGIWVEESDEIKIAESANQNNSSLRADSQNLRGKPPIKKTQDLQGGWLLRDARKFYELPRSHSLARNDKNSVRIAESALDSALSKQEANSAIADEFLGFCEASDEDRTLVHRGSEPKQSLKSRCESKFAQNLGLKIQRLYEDDDILVLNKPPFLATHGAPSLKEPSLVEWLKAHKIQRSTISGELREGIVHRLDKQTSGALVVAKNNVAHQALSAQLADKTMTRLYLAIIDLPLKEDIEIECFLARNPKNRLKISKVDVRKIRRIAESVAKNPSLRADSQNLPKFARYSKSKFYKLLPSKDGKKELILARLFTGRTHQIRAHLESINRHIVGDELYGYKRGKGENYRVMLHAYLLELRHPKHIIFAESDNSVLGMQFRTCENFQASTDLSLVESPKISTNTKAIPQSLPLRFCESQNLRENQTKSADSNADSATRTKSAESSEKNKSKKPIKSFCSVWLLPNEESLLPLNHNLPNNTDSAKLRFIAPLFDDMQDYLAKNFDMEKVNEILRTLPARAF